MREIIGEQQTIGNGFGLKKQAVIVSLRSTEVKPQKRYKPLTAVVLLQAGRLAWEAETFS
jgi:hypothetical protein